MTVANAQALFRTHLSVARVDCMHSCFVLLLFDSYYCLTYVWPASTTVVSAESFLYCL